MLPYDCRAIFSGILLNAPINVKLLGGRPSKGGGFDVTSLPVVGTFDHLPSPGGGTFDLNR